MLVQQNQISNLHHSDTGHRNGTVFNPLAPQFIASCILQTTKI